MNLLEKQNMKKPKSIVKQFYLMVIFICMMISACAPKQGQSITNNVHTSSYVKKEIKPGAPVSLDSPALVSINANQVTSINLALKTPVRVGKMHVDIIPGDGLQLLNTSAAYELALDGSSNYPFVAELLAPQNGRYYLNLHMILENDGAISARTLAVIIQVGPAVEDSVQLLKTSTSDHVISLPAEETVTPK